MREMKDSGVEWIGEIPIDWKIVKIKYLPDKAIENSYIDGDWIESPDVADEGIRYLTTGNIGDGKYKDQGNGYITLETFNRLNCKYAYPGDLIISRLNSPYGRSCILPDDFPEYVLAVDNVILRPTENKKYICYVSQCDGYQHSVEDEAKGTTMKRISRTNLGNILMPIPSSGEQERIVDYLDIKCAKIDSIIEKQQAVIEKLKEYKLSVITEAVTKGLNPDAEMRDSGIEWADDVPIHWDIMKMKNICSFHNGDRSQNYPSPEEFVDQGIPFIGADSLNGLSVDCTIAKCITEDKYKQMGGLKIEHSDILYTLRGSTIGKNSMAEFDDGTVASSLMGIRIRNKNKFIPRYILYYLNSKNEYIQRDVCINGSTAPNLSAEDVKNFVIFIPDTTEQKEIVDYLDAKCNQIEKTIADRENVVRLIQEYKKSLIYEVVTGKTEV